MVGLEGGSFEDPLRCWKVHRQLLFQLLDHPLGTLGAGHALDDVGDLAEVDPTHDRAFGHQGV